VDDADGHVAMDADGDVGRQRHRRAEAADPELDLEGERRLELAAAHDQGPGDHVVGRGRRRRGPERGDGEHERDSAQHASSSPGIHRVRTLLATAALIATGCGFERLDRVDEIFSRPGDGRRVLCATGLDDVAGNDLDSIRAGLDRAAERGEVLHLYGHSPGKTARAGKVETVISEAAARGLTFVTYADLVDGVSVPGGGVALSFDDTDVHAWYTLRDAFRQVGGRATFFVSRYDALDADRKAKLAELFADGHAVEAHTVRHQHAPDYVEEHGLDAYLRDEALPSIQGLRADGYPVRAYAYPFGARTDEIDDALREHVEVLRAVTFTTELPLVEDPCPE
jgi:hypothetical protein